MLKLSKDQQKKIDALREHWTSARNDLDSAQGDTNEQIAKIENDLNEKIADLGARARRGSQLAPRRDRERCSSYYDEKSEKWQEGDRGSSYNDWISSWQNEVEEVETVSLDTVAKVEDVPETLLSDDDYPTEPSN